MTISSIGRRVALVGSLAMLVALLPLAASAQPAGPVLRDLQVNDELDASESVQASVLWSQETFADDSADEVLIATDQDFADALASGVLQGDAPLLYTDGDTLDDLVLEEIARVGATSATILGGEVAVSPDVEAALSDEGLEVSRLEGESRIETAVAIAEQELEGDTVFIARAFGTDTDETAAFADNLALGGWAAASGTPVLLTQTDVLTGNTRAFLEANTDVTTAIVIGGEVAVSEDVVGELEELGLTVERVAGENRFGTAVAIAEARGLDAAEVDQAVFVEGQADDAYINGLAAAAYSAANDAPILLTNGENVPQETQDYLGDEADFSITDEPGEVAGVLGTNVHADAKQALADALDATLDPHMLPGPTPPTNQTFEVTPAEEATLSRVANPDTDTSDDRQYTIDGLDSEQSYVLALFTDGDVNVDDDGIVTFEDANSDNNADRTVPTADITVVNGAAQGANTSLVTVSPVNGTISFTIDGDSANETVVPVIWVDSVTGGTGVLNLTVPEAPNDEAKTPAEDFGIGGATVYAPPAAVTGDIGAVDVPITAVDKEANVIWTANFSYSYAENDTFYIRTTDSNDATDDPGTPIEQATFAEFEAAVSAGDELDASTFYQANAALPSTFVLENLSPAAPGLTVTDPSTSATEIEISVTGVVEGASVEVFIAEEDGGGGSAVTTPEWTPAGTGFTQVATITTADDEDPIAAGIQYTIPVTGSTAARDFSVVVRQIAGGETSAVTEVNDVTVPLVTETVAPTIVNTVLTTDQGTLGLVDAGDTITIDFSEQMVASLDTSGSNFIRLSDGDSTYQIVSGAAGANFALGDGPGSAAPDDRLVVTVSTLIHVGGTDNGLDYAGSTVSIVFLSAGFDDLAGNQVDLAGSADVIVDVE